MQISLQIKAVSPANRTKLIGEIEANKSLTYTQQTTHAPDQCSKAHRVAQI